MKKLPLLLLFLVSTTFSMKVLGAGTVGAMTLLESAGARPTALGDAFTAAADDITGFNYNPASLESLRSRQASFFYRTGMDDDSYGQFLFGTALPKGHIGLSVGYFDGGEINLFDGTSSRVVTVQRDTLFGVGGSFSKGSMMFGLAGKYLASELGEKKSATTYAFDAGFQLELNDRFRMGSSLQNMGPELTYDNEGDPLPTTARLGVSFVPFARWSSAVLFVDGIYDTIQSDFFPALGFEQLFGPLALRAGYKGKQDLHQFSLGAGFQISRTSFDYSFGFVDQLDAIHRISLSMKFGSSNQKPSLAHKKSISSQKTISQNSKSKPPLSFDSRLVENEK